MESTRGEYNNSGAKKQQDLAQALGVALDPPGARPRALAEAAPIIVRMIDDMVDRIGRLESAVRNKVVLTKVQANDSLLSSLPRKELRRVATGDSAPIPPARVEAARRVPIEEIARKCGLDRTLKWQSGELVGPCPKCGGDDRFSINPAKDVWNCRRCEKGRDALKLIMHFEGCGFREAVERLTPEFGEAKKKPPKPPVKTNPKRRLVTVLEETKFQFCDPATGESRYCKIRQDGLDQFGEKFKETWFDPKHRGGTKEHPSPPLLYRGDRLADLSPGDSVFIVEGENKVERLRALGFAAVSGDDGTSSKWLPAHARLFRGLAVVLWPDSDPVGEKYIHKVAAALLAECPGIDLRIVRPFGPPNGSAESLDVCDWQGGPEELQTLIDGAEPYEAPPGKVTQRREFLCDEKGHPYGNLANAMTVLRNDPAFAGALEFNEMAQDAILLRNIPLVGDKPAPDPPRLVSDDDVSRLQDWLQHKGLPRINHSTCGQALHLRAREFRRHPVREWLNGLEQTGFQHG
jgi:CHC2 zinc finger